MIQLLEGGAWLVNGNQVIPDGPEAAAAVEAAVGKKPVKEDAKKETISYGILESHNTSDSMENLKIRFDKLTSHDSTFVGIIQTARASGLTKFRVRADQIPDPLRAHQLPQFPVRGGRHHQRR